jgi:hypothetical protein
MVVEVTQGGGWVHGRCQPSRGCADGAGGTIGRHREGRALLLQRDLEVEWFCMKLPRVDRRLAVLCSQHHAGRACSEATSCNYTTPKGRHHNASGQVPHPDGCIPLLSFLHSCCQHVHAAPPNHNQSYGNLGGGHLWFVGLERSVLLRSRWSTTCVQGQGQYQIQHCGAR